eukprot:scaffold76200_cov63-Phaeocystis_antarctica.AAC.3
MSCRMRFLKEPKSHQVCGGTAQTHRTTNIKVNLDKRKSGMPEDPRSSQGAANHWGSSGASVCCLNTRILSTACTSSSVSPVR